MWDAKWLLFTVVSCRQDLWIQNQPMLGERPGRHSHTETKRTPTNGRFPIKGNTTLLPAHSPLSSWQVWGSAGTQSFFTFLWIILSFSHSSTYVWAEGGHSRREIWVPHSSSPLISHLLFTSVNILFYSMYICQRNVGLSSRQAYFPLPSWDILELNSMSLHS